MASIALSRRFAAALEVEAIAKSRRYDLTFLTAADFQWVDDGSRKSEGARRRMQRSLRGGARPPPGDRDSEPAHAVVSLPRFRRSSCCSSQPDLRVFTPLSSTINSYQLY